MISLRLTDKARLDLLSAAVLDYLEDSFSESQLDDDSSPPYTTLYNLAYCLLHRSSSDPDAEAFADHELSQAIQYGAVAKGHLDLTWAALKAQLP